MLKHKVLTTIKSGRSRLLPLLLFPILAAGTPSQLAAQSALLQSDNFHYLGAFRLPEGDLRPNTFEYGGNAMTFNPDGDATGPTDGFPGSLFVTGHDRMPYGELPDGSRVAEITIPAPIASEAVSDLPRADYLQPLTDVAAGYFTGLDELPRLGLLYLNRPETGPLLHLAWGQHFQPDPPAPSHAWFSPNLATPNMQGSWFIADQNPYSVNGYLFEIPAGWADQHTAGRFIATGRYRDGGWSGMGPALFAYTPWIDDQGTPAPDGTHLAATVLLRYASSETAPPTEHTLAGYQHPDEWEGGAWLTTSDGRSAVLLVGTKAVGEKYWYGWVNPAGPEYPCVETELLGQFDLCYLADGTPCPPEDLSGCAGHNDYRGWWSSAFAAEFILYHPDDLAQVAAGHLAPDQPQPYAAWSIDDHLFLNPAGVEPDNLGTGVQRRNRIGDAAYDRANQLLYVLEWFADGAQPVVHVWHLE